MLDAREAHVCITGLSAEQRMNILHCARAIKEAKGDKLKRRRAYKNFRTCLDFYEYKGVLTPEQAEGIYYALYKGI